MRVLKGIKSHTIFSVMIFLLSHCGNYDTVSGPTQTTDPFENYTAFDYSEKINTIYLAVDSSELQYLLDNPTEKGKEFERECKFLGVFKSDTVFLDCGLRIHGGVSRQYPKKSFRLYFRDNELISNNIFTLFPQNTTHANRFSKIILNATAIDFSYIRNFLSMYITNAVGAMVPRVDFVRLYINEKPYGLYQISEAIHDDMIEYIIHHDDIDLLKSETHNGDLKTENYYFIHPNSNVPDSLKKDSLVSPCKGFKLKDGDTVSVSRLVYWMESDSFSYNQLQNMTTDKTLFGFFAGCYYTGDTDVLSKNYYYLLDRRSNLFELIRWDADAALGRNWCGDIEKCNHFSYKEMIIKNGLFNKISHNSEWVGYFRERMSSAFGAGLNTQSLLQFINELEELLEDEVRLDLSVWGETLLDYFCNEKGWKHWDYSESDTLSVWKNDLQIIRDFISERQQTILSELL